MIVFDTETTGFPIHTHRLESPDQPHLVEIGARLYRDEELINSLDALIKPEGYLIPDKATAVHGISTEMALEKGVPLDKAMLKFVGMYNFADMAVAYNEKFDRTILSIALLRLGTCWEKAMKLIPSIDVMIEMTSICRIPLGNQFKWPRLSEAYEFCFSEQAPVKHRAGDDAEATMRIFRALQNRKFPGTTMNLL